MSSPSCPSTQFYHTSSYIAEIWSWFGIAYVSGQMPANEYEVDGVTDRLPQNARRLFPAGSTFHPSRIARAKGRRLSQHSRLAVSGRQVERAYVGVSLWLEYRLRCHGGGEAE